MFEKSRRTKEQVIERERQLASQVSFDAATLQNISLTEQAYIHAARYFEKSIASEEKKKTRNANRLAFIFGFLAFLAIAAVAGLTPLKTVELHLIRVDNNSGFTDVVTPASSAKSTEQIDDEYWLSSYVRFRESYNFSSSISVFSIVELMSYPDTFTEYRNFQLSSKGYTNVLGNNRQIRTDINNILFLDRDNAKGTAQVRYTKTVLDKNGVPDPQIRPSIWVATVSYDYKNPAKKRGEEWINPRGFGVQSYLPTQEVGGSHDK